MNQRLKGLLGLSMVTLLAGGAAMAQSPQRYLQSLERDGVTDVSGDCVLTVGGRAIDDCLARAQTAGGSRPPPLLEVSFPSAQHSGDIAVDSQGIPLPLSLGADANFDFDRAELRPAARRALDELVAILRQPTIEIAAIEITGHTDSVGSDAYNDELSRRRAQSVADYLVNSGVASRLMQIEGRGERQPIASNSDEAGRARNRRVDIVVDAARRR